MECADTLAPVKHLCEVLLRDYNQRYKPGDEYGKEKYTSKPEVGYMKSKTGVRILTFSTQPSWTRVPNANPKVPIRRKDIT